MADTSKHSALLLENLFSFFVDRKKLFAAVILIFFTSVGSSVIFRAAVSSKQRTDFTVYLAASNAITTGENLYEVTNEKGWNYVYSPLLAILLLPVHKLPLGASVTVWYLISAACIFGTCLLSSRLLEDKREGLILAISAFFFSLPLFLDSLTMGQTGTIILFLMFAVYFCFDRGWDIASGFLLAFAVSLKLSPLAVLVFFFLFKRKWKILASFAAGCLVFLVLFPAAVLGWERNLFLLKEWLVTMREAVADTSQTHKLWRQLMNPFDSDNQSLYAVLTRLYWDNDVAFLGESNAMIKSLTRLVGLGLLFLLGWTGNKIASREKTLALYMLFPFVMLFSSPVTEVHHYTMLYGLMFSALVLARKTNVLITAFFIWLGGLSFVLGMTLGDLAQIGLPLWGAVILWFFVFSQASRPGTLRRGT